MALLLTGAVTVRSQPAGSQALIRERVDESKLVTLAGNTRPEASAGNDLGAAPDELPLQHMLLQLRRSPQQERAAEQLIDGLHNPKSPNFHKWLTASEFGKTYGLSAADLKTVTGWLESHGFVVNSVYPSGMVIDFSGNAGLVRSAFHTSIHTLNVAGVRHIANFGDPQIPAALAPAVAGVVSLHDFRPHKAIHPAYTFTYEGQNYQLVVPADIATIYDFNPAFSAGITGAGQTIVVIEDTDLYSQDDWTTFRDTFGLSQYPGTLTSENPVGPGGASCPDPGVNADDVEVAADVEYSSAAAPGAAIVVAACDDTSSLTSGLITAMQNVVNGSNPPQIMSLSYGECEPLNGAAANAALYTLYQQAAAEGISVFTSSGDEGAASCDYDGISATHGIAVSGFASTPYNVAVGGTDFADVVDGTTGAYWRPFNSPNYGSAVSYIPEIPWNDSCAGKLLANYYGYSTGYGSAGFCNSSTALDYGFLSTSAGSGGPSNCATGAPSAGGVANGTCQGYAKPAWQSGVSGIANDGVRDIPDVSMFAADPTSWGHGYVFCFSDVYNGGSFCEGPPEDWSVTGGTSFAAPIMAGVQALVNQNAGGPQGDPNYVYYALAATAPSVFHATNQGDIDVNCAGIYNCYGILGTPDFGRGGRIFGTTWGGNLSVSNSSFTPAYNAGSTWNFATGLGSVDVYNLVTNWIANQ